MFPTVAEPKLANRTPILEKISRPFNAVADYAFLSRNSREVKYSPAPKSPAELALRTSVKAMLPQDSKDADIELAVSELIKTNSYVSAGMSQAAAIEFSKQLHVAVNYSCPMSGHGTQQAFREASLMVVENKIDENSTIIISPSLREIHKFPNALFHFYKTDAADVQRAVSKCGCHQVPCGILAKARSEHRVSYGPISSIPNNLLRELRYMLLTYIEPNVHVKELTAVLAAAPHMKIYSSLNIAPLAFLGPVSSKYGKDTHQVVADKYTVMLASGDTYVHPLRNVRALLAPMVAGPIVVKRTIVCNFENEYLTELVVASGTEAVAWNPFPQHQFYFLPNFLIPDSYVAVEREAYDNLLRRLMSVDFSDESIWKAINTSSMAVTLSGIQLSGKLRADFDSTLAVKVFTSVYIPITVRAADAAQTSTEVSYKNIATKLLSVATGYNASLGNAGVIRAVAHFFTDLSGYTSLSVVSDRSLDAVYGAKYKSISVVGRFQRWYRANGFERAHKSLYKRHLDTEKLVGVVSDAASSLLSMGAKIATASVVGVVGLFKHALDIFIKVGLVAEKSTTLAVEAAAIILCFLIDDFIPDTVLGEPYHTTCLAIIYQLVGGYTRMRDVYMELVLLTAISGKTKTLMPFFNVFKTILLTSGPVQIGIAYKNALIRGVPIEYSTSVMKLISELGITSAEIIQAQKEAEEVLAAEAPKIITNSRNLDLSADKVPLLIHDHNRVLDVPTSPETGMFDFTCIKEHTRKVVPNYEGDFHWTEDLLGVTIPVCSEDVPIFVNATFDARDVARRPPQPVDCEREFDHFQREMACSDLEVAKACVENICRMYERKGARIFEADILITGLPMSGKSAGMRMILDERDLVVVPTVALKAQWEEAFAEKKSKPTVLTQHTALSRSGYRIVCIDEVPTLSAIHVALLSQLGHRSIHLGDFSQIPAVFAMSKLQIPMKAEAFTYRTMLQVIVSFMPRDALHLCAHLGVNTLGYNGPIYSAASVKKSLYYTHVSNRSIGANLLTGTQPGKALMLKDFPNVHSAHESQGSRYDRTQVLFTEYEAAFFRRNTRHLLVCVSRCREETLFLTEGMSDIRLIPGFSTGVNGEINVIDLPWVATTFGNFQDDIVEHESASKITFVEPEYPREIRVLSEHIYVFIPPNGGKSYLSRKYSQFIDIDDLIRPEWRDNEQWDVINSEVPRMLSRMPPSVILCHHPAQVGFPKTGIVLVHPFRPVDCKRAEAYDMNTNSLLKFDPLYLKTREDIERTIVEFFYSNSRSIHPLRADVPLISFMEWRHQYGHVDAVHIEDSIYARIKSVNVNNLLDKAQRSKQEVRYDNTQGHLTSITSLLTRGNSENRELGRALSVTDRARIRTLFRPEAKKFNSLAYTKKSEKMRKILNHLDPKTSELVASAFVKGGLPKKTSDMLKFQGVIADPPAIQAMFAGWVANITAFLQLNLRKNIQTAIGRNEEEIAIMVQQIAEHNPEALANDFDIKKQDTNHTPKHVALFALLSEMAGMPDIFGAIFTWLRSEQRIADIDAIFKLLNEWALGSGSSWTITSNTWMAICTIVLDTYFDPTRHWMIEVGDDGTTSVRLVYVPREERVFPNVEFETRRGRLAAFCSRIYAGITIRNLGRKTADILKADVTNMNYKERLRSWQDVYSEIKSVGREYYAKTLCLGFDYFDEQAIRVVDNYVEAFEYAYSRLHEHDQAISRVRIVRQIVSTKTRCFYNALSAYDVKAADYAVGFNRDNVPFDECERLLRERAIPHKIEKRDYNGQIVNKISQEEPDFRGIILFWNHAVAIVNRENAVIDYSVSRTITQELPPIFDVKCQVFDLIEVSSVATSLVNHYLVCTSVDTKNRPTTAVDFGGYDKFSQGFHTFYRHDLPNPYWRVVNIHKSMRPTDATKKIVMSLLSPKEYNVAKNNCTHWANDVAYHNRFSYAADNFGWILRLLKAGEPLSEVMQQKAPLQP